MRRAIVFGWHNVLPSFHYPMSGDAVAGLERQLRFIRACADVIPANDLTSLSSGRRRIGRPAAVLTFDDGYADALDVIAPMLARLGLPATFFLVPGFLDGSVRPWWEVDENGQLGTTLLDWEGAHGLVRMGFGVGSHTMDHARLSELTPERRTSELVDSRVVLAERLGVPIDLVAYPFGDARSVTDEVARSAAEAGYTAGFTTRPGAYSVRSDPMLIRRFVIDPSLSLRAFDQLPRHWFGRVRSMLRGGRVRGTASAA